MLLRLLEAFPAAHVTLGFFRSVITVHTDEYREKKKKSIPVTFYSVLLMVNQKAKCKSRPCLLKISFIVSIILSHTSKKHLDLFLQFTVYNQLIAY